MTNVTLADLRNSAEFLNSEEILHIFDGRKKEEMGFFVSIHFENEFMEFVKQLEVKKRAKK